MFVTIFNYPVLGIQTSSTFQGISTATAFESVAFFTSTLINCYVFIVEQVASKRTHGC